MEMCVIYSEIPFTCPAELCNTYSLSSLIICAELYVTLLRERDSVNQIEVSGPCHLLHAYLTKTYFSYREETLAPCSVCHQRVWEIHFMLVWFDWCSGWRSLSDVCCIRNECAEPYISNTADMDMKRLDAAVCLCASGHVYVYTYTKTNVYVVV